MSAIPKLKNSKGSLTMSSIIIISISLIALWLIVTGPLAGLKNYADKNWNMFSPYLAEPTKEKEPLFKQGENVWWYDQEYKEAGIITAVDVQENQYTYLVDFSKDQNSQASLWLTQEHLRKAEIPRHKIGSVVQFANQKLVVLNSEPNPQGIFLYKLMQIESQPRIITELEKNLADSKTQLITAQGKLKPESIVWWQDSNQKNAGKIMHAYTLDGNTIYSLKHIQEQLSDTTPSTIYVKEEYLHGPAYKTGTRVTWKLTAKDLQEEKELTGTGIISTQAPTWAEGYLYKISIQQAGDTEPKFLVPEENIEAT